MIQTSKIGPLDCTVVGPYSGQNKPKLVVVLCHGFGAPGTDLVPLAEEILGASSIDPNEVTFVFPAAAKPRRSRGPLNKTLENLYNQQERREE